MRKETYKKLTAVYLEESQKEKHGNYSILVHENWGAHTAFYTEEGFQEWMNQRNLKLGDNPGKYNGCIEIIGEYSKVWFLDIEPNLPDFSNCYNNLTWNGEMFRNFGEKNNLKEIRVMDNGDYTTGFVFTGINADGRNYNETITVIYLLNPNCKREIWDYKQCAEWFRFKS